MFPHSAQFIVIHSTLSLFLSRARKAIFCLVRKRERACEFASKIMRAAPSKFTYANCSLFSLFPRFLFHPPFFVNCYLSNLFGFVNVFINRFENTRFALDKYIIHARDAFDDITKMLKRLIGSYCRALERRVAIESAKLKKCIPPLRRCAIAKIFLRECTTIREQ